MYLYYISNRWQQIFLKNALLSWPHITMETFHTSFPDWWGNSNTQFSRDLRLTPLGILLAWNYTVSHELFWVGNQLECFSVLIWLHLRSYWLWFTALLLTHLSCNIDWCSAHYSHRSQCGGERLKIYELMQFARRDHQRYFPSTNFRDYYSL